MKIYVDVLMVKDWISSNLKMNLTHYYWLQIVFDKLLFESRFFDRNGKQTIVLWNSLNFKQTNRYCILKSFKIKYKSAILRIFDHFIFELFSNLRNFRSFCFRTNLWQPSTSQPHAVPFKLPHWQTKTKKKLEKQLTIENKKLTFQNN